MHVCTPTPTSPWLLVSSVCARAGHTPAGKINALATSGSPATGGLAPAASLRFLVGLLLGRVVPAGLCVSASEAQ